jgi:hypothetical protein
MMDDGRRVRVREGYDDLKIIAAIKAQCVRRSL